MKCLIWCAIREAELLENVAVKATRSENSALLFFFFVKRPAGLARGFCGARLGPSCRPRRTEAGEQEKQENGGWRQFGLNAKKICGGQKKKGPCDILIFRKNENDVGWLKGNRVSGLGRWRGRLFELIVSRNGAPMSCGMGGKGWGPQERLGSSAIGSRFGL